MRLEAQKGYPVQAEKDLPKLRRLSVGNTLDDGHGCLKSSCGLCCVYGERHPVPPPGAERPGRI